jgi:5-methylthioadenosine/S-adenosylhomocysteine deaminase
MPAPCRHTPYCHGHTERRDCAGLGDQTGSLVKGKWADLAAINLDTLETQPLFDPVSQLVYASSREQVTDVGWPECNLLKRQLTTLDGADILERAHAWQRRIGSKP